MVSDAGGSFVFKEGVWLKFYDPDANDGAGGFEFTDDPSEALAFEDAAQAAELWRRVSVVRPVRLDGQPNRPLSAFTISISELPPNRSGGEEGLAEVAGEAGARP